MPARSSGVFRRTGIQSPALEARLLSLGSARDGARSSLEDLARAGLVLENHAQSVACEGVELPNLLLRLLLDFARRPRGTKPRQRHLRSKTSRGLASLI